MGRKGSLRWLQLALAVVLLFGSCLPAFAETQNVKGLVAQVQDETGAPLNQGEVILYEYNHYSNSYNGFAYYANQAYYTNVRNGEFFIPNSFILKGKTYDLVVKGQSPAGADLVYRYSFTGGDLDTLNFTASQLKQFTFTHDQEAKGDLFLMPKDAYGNTDKVYYPTFVRSFDQNRSVSVWLASNTGFDAYASLIGPETREGYFMELRVPKNAVSQSYRFGGELVKVTAPSGFSRSKVFAGLNQIGTQYGADAVYVTKGMKGSVTFSVLQDNLVYSYTRSGVEFTQNIDLMLDRELTGQVQEVGRKAQSNDADVYIRYMDKYGNQLFRVYPLDTGTSGTAAQNKGMWIASADENGYPVRSELNEAGTAVLQDKVQDLSAGTPMMEYQLVGSDGQVIQTVRVNDYNEIYRVSFTNVPPGAYRLRLSNQFFPKTVASLTMDQPVNLSPSGKSIPVELPSGYDYGVLGSGMIMELEGDKVRNYSQFSGSNKEIPLSLPIRADRQYRVLAAFNMKSTDAPAQAAYLLDQTYTGEQLQALTRFPLETGLVRTTFPLQGTSITWGAIVELSLQVPSLSENERNQFGFSAPGVLYSRPATFSASVVGTDGEANGYHYAKTVTIPQQDRYEVRFADLADSLVPVELTRGGEVVPFQMFTVIKGNNKVFNGNSYSSMADTNKLTKIWTTPGQYQFRISHIKQADLEAPWSYMWDTDLIDVAQATKLPFGDAIESQAFGPLNDYKFTNGKDNYIGLHTSAIIKAGAFKLHGVAVKRGSSYQVSSSAVEGTRPYNGGYYYYTWIPGTFSVTDLAGNMVTKTDVYYTESLYAEFKEAAGTYQLTYRLPVGPGQEVTITQPFTTGDPNTPPGKPAPVAAFAGQGLKLTWQAVAGASYYDVYAAQQGQPLAKVKGNLTETSFTYAEAQAGKTYDLKVVAVNGKGISTESDTVSFAVPEFAVSQLDVKAAEIQSPAGLLKIGAKLPIELTGSAGEGIAAKAFVTYRKQGAANPVTDELTLAFSEGKYKGTFPVQEGMTEIVSVKAYLLKDTLASSELEQKMNKKIGATLTGTVKQRGEPKGQATVEVLVNGTYLTAVTQADGGFTVAGVPQGQVKVNVIAGERFTDQVKNAEAQYGTTSAIGIVNLPVLQNVKIRLLDSGSEQAVSRALAVSISGPANKEGYIGPDGYFVTYSGETELKRLKPGTYTIAVKGAGLYDSLQSTFTIDETTNYLVNPVLVPVAKKSKLGAQVTLELFMPVDEEVQTAPASRVQSYSLYSPSATQAFGWEAGYQYGYNQQMTVSERVYVTNPQHVLGGGTSTTVTEKVYGFIGTVAVPELAAAQDYSADILIQGFQPVYRSGLAIAAGQSTLKLALQPAVVYEGLVLDANGRPVANADVSASAGSSYAYARTDAEGRYTLDRLAETGELRVSIQAVGFTSYNETLAVNGRTVPTVTLENDQFIHGVVVDKDNHPLKHVYVYASGSKNSGWARTDANGYFKIRGLSAGSYQFNANLYGYPSVTKTIATSANQETIVMQSQSGQFAGAGNSFAPSVTTAVYGKEVMYRLNFKNNSSTAAAGTVWTFELPSSVSLVNGSVELNGVSIQPVRNGSLLQVNAQDVAAGASGTISFKVLVDKAEEESLRVAAYPMINGSREEPTQVATVSVLYVTLNAPAVIGDKKIKVYGNTKPGSTVDIYAGAVRLGRVTAEGRWWYADVVLPVDDGVTEAEFLLSARVADDEHGSQSSELATVKYAANVPGLEEVSVTAGWNVNVKLNPKLPVATFAVTEKTPIQTKVVFKEAVEEASIAFIGNEYALAKSSDGKTFTGEVPYGWSSYGEQLLTLTYKNKGVTVTVPLMEVIVLIDPSGYVFEGSMDNRLPGVTAIVQQETNGQWSSWDAENFGQVNPQTTDSEGRYGWDVVQGNWRVLFSKEGYEDYTSRTVIVPPAETQLNVPMVRTSAPKIESVTPADKAANVGVSSDIEIVFDRPMAQEGMTASVFSLVKVEGDKETAVEFSLVYQNMNGYKADVSKETGLPDGNNETGWFIPDETKKLTKKLAIKPAAALAQGSTYKVTVKGNLTDYTGSNILTADSSYTFTTAAGGTVTPPPAPVCCSGGGGGGGTSAAANELDLGFVELNKWTSNNEVKVTLGEKQDTLIVSGSVWNVIQNRGYTVKVQHSHGVVTVPSKAFTLKDEDTFVLELKPAADAYPAGYRASSAVVRVGVAKKKNGKPEELAASEPLAIKLAAAPSNEPELIGAYEFVNGTPHYLGRSIEVQFKSTGTFGLAAYERPFADVEGHWAKQDIRYLVSHHIVDGVTDTAFQPAGTTTRAQIAKLLAGMLQLDKAEGKSSFADVAQDAWYADAVAAVEKAGLFQGADGQFRPDASISRQELAVVISRLVKSPDQTAGTAFADQAQIAGWAQAGVGAAAKLGIIQGDDAGNFKPEAHATRAEAAAMVRRLIQVLDKQ